jgi:hypothetical protein
VIVEWTDARGVTDVPGEELKVKKKGPISRLRLFGTRNLNIIGHASSPGVEKE